MCEENFKNLKKISILMVLRLREIQVFEFLEHKSMI